MCKFVCLSCLYSTRIISHIKCFAEKCYECSGNEADCGRDISVVLNNTEKIKIIDCGMGDCWSYRMEDNGAVSFKRKCAYEKCTSTNQDEVCKAISGKRECKRCCTNEKCNVWKLNGQASYISRNFFFFIVLVFFIEFCLNI